MMFISFIPLLILFTCYIDDWKWNIEILIVYLSIISVFALCILEVCYVVLTFCILNYFDSFIIM